MTLHHFDPTTLPFRAGDTMTDTTLYRPHPQQFRTGDLVWVKRDDQFIAFTEPHAAQHAPASVKASAQAALEHAGWTALQRHEIASWQPDPWTADIWVGHIGIVHMLQGQPWVIDATPSRHQPHVEGLPAPTNLPGVAIQTYAAWLSDSDHTASHVWHGRVKGLSTVQAQQTIAFARSHLGKAYRFVPWGFASHQLFYCSELVWCAVREASGIILDDIDSTLRVDWFTPWMAMKSPHIEMLYEPPNRPYGGLT
jgi:cell wall-associated NlpC family hydrolase